MSRAVRRVDSLAAESPPDRRQGCEHDALHDCRRPGQRRARRAQSRKATAICRRPGIPLLFVFPCCSSFHRGPARKSSRRTSRYRAPVEAQRAPWLPSDPGSASRAERQRGRQPPPPNRPHANSQPTRVRSCQLGLGSAPLAEHAGARRQRRRQGGEKAQTRRALHLWFGRSRSM